MFFMNFVISIPVVLFFLGYWYRKRSEPSWKAFLVKAFLLLVIYYCHMLAFAFAAGAVLVYTLAERRDLKALFKESLIAVPGVLLFFLWIASMITTRTVSESQLQIVSLYPALGEKIKDLVESISPVFLPDDYRSWYQFLFSFFSLSMVVLGLFGEGRENAQKVWSRVIIVFFIVAALMSRWLVIYLPGPRIALLTLFVAPVLFPKRRTVRYGFLCFLILFTVFLRRWEMQYLDEQSRVISSVIEPFKDLPASIREKGDTVLPCVLRPYTFYKTYHRIFDYYVMIQGGINPYHLIGPDYAVRYRTRLPAPPQYEPFPENLPKEMLNAYAVVLVIGKNGERGPELIHHLLANGFAEVRGNEFTGVFARR
jgi:hypothetical protein